MVEWAKITFQRNNKCNHVKRTCSAASLALIVIFKNEAGEILFLLVVILHNFEDVFWEKNKINLPNNNYKRFLVARDIVQWKYEETAGLNEVCSFSNKRNIGEVSTYLSQIITNKVIVCKIIISMQITTMFDISTAYNGKNVVIVDANNKPMGDQTIQVRISCVTDCDEMGKLSMQRLNLSFDEIVILGGIRILLGFVKENGLIHYLPIIAQRFVERLRANSTIKAILQRLQHIIDAGNDHILKKYATIAYDIMLHHRIKMELQQQMTMGNLWIDDLKKWMLAISSDERYCYGGVPLRVMDNQSINENNTTKDAIDSCVAESNGNNIKAKGCSAVKVFSEINQSGKSFLYSQNTGPVQKYNSVPVDQVPIPVWCVVRVKEGERELQVVEGSCKGAINQGDKIRIGHPFLSRLYHVVGVTFCSENLVGKTYIYTQETFDHSPVLYEELVKGIDKPSLLHNPKLRLKSIGARKRLIEPSDLEADYKEAYYDIHAENFNSRSILAFARIRIWKLVPAASDHRLQWRKEYDDGSVPWFDLFSLSPEFKIPRNFLKVNVNLVQIDKDCHDCLSGPESSIHQQRLRYFEKVPLSAIIIKTFQTMCDWHPVSSSIDMFKWTKLTRKMKFLISAKNNNHRLDMIFMKHSFNRKLNVAQFRSVLKDIAAIRFPPARYNVHESMANLLWSTVAMIPNVNEMIWMRAQGMAMIEEARRVCAQTRIGARLRMLLCKRSYLRIRSSAILIGKYIRCVLMRQKISRTLLLLRYDRIFRIRHLNAIVCQKNWRGYKRRFQFQIYKEQRNHMLQEARAKRRKKLQQKFRKCMRSVIYRKVQRIQSFLTIVWILLRDRRHVNQGVEVEIQVLVPYACIAKYFKLTEKEIAKCLDKYIFQRGPLSLGEMLDPFFLSHLTSRLWLQVVDDNLFTVNFNFSGVIEKGDLVHSCIATFNDVKYTLSMYKSGSSLAIRLYCSKGDNNLRVAIALYLLAAWLSIYTEESTAGQVEALRVWELYQMFKNYNSDDEGMKLDMDRCGASMELLSRDSTSLDFSRESGLIPWIMDRIDVFHDPISQNDSIVLQFERDAKRLEKMAIVLQRVWRGKRAKMMAKEEVFRQYEKCFDVTLRAFFYINILTSQKQWTKPRLLSENDDIADPPDEWRTAEYFDRETNTSKKYYFNPLTGQSSWITEVEAARILQRKFRTRATQDLITSNLNFSQIVKAVKYTDDIERKYKHNPLKLSSRVNFALLNHCLNFDVQRAKSLYEDAISQSPCHPVISRAYGIFILATSSETEMTQNFKRACNFFKEAEVIDPGALKFRSAIENFFYWSVILYPNNPDALLNYALLHQCILGEYYRAERIYRRALSFDSKNRNVANNYHIFIDQLYPGGFYAGNGVPNVVIRRSQVKKTSPDWGEWKVMFDPLCTNSYDSFWYNSIDFVSSFEEPNWADVWTKRVARSSLVTTNSDSLWVEYFDPKLNTSFLYNRTTDEYAWKRSAS